jgi:predicted PurR-regulated permease PerM
MGTDGRVARGVAKRRKSDAGRPDERLSRRLSRGAPLAAVVLVVSAVALFLTYALLPVLKLIAIALLLALAMRTVVRGLEEARFPTWLSAIVLLLGVGAFGALVWLVMVPNLSREFRQLTSEGSGSLQSVANLFHDLPLFSEASRFSEQLRGYLSGLVNSLPELLYTAGSALAAAVAVVFLAVYLAVNPDAYISGILRLVPGERRKGVEDFVDRVGARLRGWIIGVAFVASFVGSGAGLGLWALGIPLPLTLGLLAGLLNVIPFAGSILGGALATLMALTISPLKALEVAALFLVLNQIEGNILQPQIMGRQVRISTAVIIVSFLVLGTLLGPIIGVFLAVPATVVASVILDELGKESPPLESDGRGAKAIRRSEADP